MKPLLPESNKILPYLRRIDESRHYCNFGPLNEEYQERLSGLFEAPIVTCSSATSGLIAALLAFELPKGSLIACPSWTFIATPAAIVNAGHIPYFCDVGTDGIMSMSNVPNTVSAIIAVSPCGLPVDQLPLVAANCNVPIIIDAAGGFDSFSTFCKPGKIPVVVSTHGTKVFGTGEGGFVTCHNKPLLEKIKHITNFGFNDSRKAISRGFNAKLSEYHAAVGLAELDGWEEKRQKYLKKTKIYGLNYATSLVPSTSGEGRKGVYGCHTHKAYKDYPRTNLPVTESLIKKTAFVPITL